MKDLRKLLTPVSDVWDWQMRGACRGMNTELFFHPESERGAVRAARESRAKDVCQGCPVLEQCRRHSLMVREPYGIWGGLSVAERNAISDEYRDHRGNPSSTATRVRIRGLGPV